MAVACVMGNIGKVRADAFVVGDLVEQPRQGRTVRVLAVSEVYRPDFGSGSVQCAMQLAPLASTLNTMLAHLLFNIAEGLDTGTTDEQVQRPIRAAISDLNRKDLLSLA